MLDVHPPHQASHIWKDLTSWRWWTNSTVCSRPIAMSRPMTIVMMWMKNPIRGGEGDQHPVLSQRREVPNVRYHTRPEDAVSRIFIVPIIQHEDTVSPQLYRACRRA
jgi:hypothetical protein